MVNFSISANTRAPRNTLQRVQPCNPEMHKRAEKAALAASWGSKPITAVAESRHAPPYNETNTPPTDPDALTLVPYLCTKHGVRGASIDSLLEHFGGVVARFNFLSPHG